MELPRARSVMARLRSMVVLTALGLLSKECSSEAHHARVAAGSSWTRGLATTSALRTTLQLQGGARSPSWFSGQANKNNADGPEELGEREKLYEAYNLLHKLGKEFNLEIKAPSVLVVGHQTAGKSALIEALMGFQFNNVGGGTKTRRPIALHMRYNPDCIEPTCYLTDDSTGVEEHMSLEEIQAFITRENERLEADPSRNFDHREIVVRVEYKYCPNMVVVDTPGLIGTSGGRNDEFLGGRARTKHERAHQQMVKEAEQLAMNKMRSPEYIILCIEDTTDWRHGSMRNLVQRADPHLSRTVLVNTKLDTKLLQFAEAVDIEDFVSAPIVKRLHPHLAGGPFFTSVPAGRVGQKRNSAYLNNDAFLRGLRRREQEDSRIIESKVGSRAASDLEHAMGVRRLRHFLETKVERCYRANVASIVPVLGAALLRCEEAAAKVEGELAALSTDSLRDAANQYREHYARAVSDCVQGTIAAPPSQFGESLEDEQLGGGNFVAAAAKAASPGGGANDGDKESYWNLVEAEVAHASAKLYGGAQYHRALREFALAVQHIGLPEVTADEIANAAGLSDTHDGTNYMRAACVIAVDKAQTSFGPLLSALQLRARHVMRRLHPIADYMLDVKGVSLHATHAEGMGPKNAAVAAAQAAALGDAVRDIYFDFVECALAECLKRCEDDLRGMTRFVTWDLEERGSLAIADSLPSKEMVHVYALTMDKQNGRGGRNSYDKDYDPEGLSRRGDNEGSSRRGRFGRGRGGGGGGGAEESVVDEWAEYSGKASFELDEYYGDTDTDRRWDYEQGGRGGGGRSGGDRRDLALTQMQERTPTKVDRSESTDVMALMEQVACMRDGSRTTKVVAALVQHIVRAWRMSFAQNVAMKFNCFFLLPFMDEFPFYLRSRLDKMYDVELASLFDLSDARAHLEQRLQDLAEEAEANRRLQSKFEDVNRQINKGRLARGEDGAEEAEDIVGGPLPPPSPMAVDAYDEGEDDLDDNEEAAWRRSIVEEDAAVQPAGSRRRGGRRSRRRSSSSARPAKEVSDVESSVNFEDGEDEDELLEDEFEEEEEEEEEEFEVEDSGGGWDDDEDGPGEWWLDDDDDDDDENLI